MKGSIVFVPRDRNRQRFVFVRGEDGRQYLVHGGAVSDASPVPFDDLEEGDVLEYQVEPGTTKAAKQSAWLIAKDGDYVPEEG